MSWFITCGLGYLVNRWPPSTSIVHRRGYASSRLVQHEVPHPSAQVHKYKGPTAWLSSQPTNSSEKGSSMKIKMSVSPSQPFSPGQRMRVCVCCYSCSCLLSLCCCPGYYAPSSRSGEQQSGPPSRAVSIVATQSSIFAIRRCNTSGDYVQQVSCIINDVHRCIIEQHHSICTEGFQNGRCKE